MPLCPVAGEQSERAASAAGYQGTQLVVGWLRSCLWSGDHKTFPPSCRRPTKLDFFADQREVKKSLRSGVRPTPTGRCRLASGSDSIEGQANRVQPLAPVRHGQGAAAERDLQQRSC